MSTPTVDQIIQEILGGTIQAGRKSKHHKKHHKRSRSMHRRSPRGGVASSGATIAQQLLKGGNVTWKDHLQQTYEQLKAGDKHGMHGGQLFSEAMKIASSTYTPKGGRR
jgi:hypothetical protein